MDKKDILKSLAAEINKQFKGEARVYIGDEIPNPFKERIPTGSIGLDKATNGGIPRGGLTQYIGLDGSGKTTMAIKTAVEVQKLFGEDSAIAYAGVEGPLDLDWAQKLGLDINKNVLNISASSAENYIEALKKIIDSNEFQLVIVDSIPAFITSAEKEADFGDAQVAVSARLLAKFSRKCLWGAAPDKNGQPNKTAIIAINQFRSKIGGWSPAGEPLEQSGGKALRYAKLLDITFKASKRIEVKEDDGSKIVAGKEIKYMITKGKAGCHEGGSGQFDLYFSDFSGMKAGNIDIGKEYRVIGTLYGLFEKAGGFVKYKDTNYRQKELEDMLSSDTIFREQVREEILASIGASDEISEEDGE